MLDDEGLGILYYQCEVTTTTGTGHLPCKDVVHGAILCDGFADVAVVLLGMTYVSGGDHTGEHGCLGLEGGSVGGGKGVEIVLQDGLPTSFGSIGQGLDLGGSDVLTLHHGATGLARGHGNHHEVLFEEAEGHLVIGALDLLGPEVIVVVVAAKAGDADADGVLGTRDVTVFALGIVLEAEHEAGKHLGIHLGELDGPYLLNHLAGRGAQAATIAHVEGGSNDMVMAQPG